MRFAADENLDGRVLSGLAPDIVRVIRTEYLTHSQTNHTGCSAAIVAFRTSIPDSLWKTIFQLSV
jgi:hypothetical protein